MTRRRTNRHRKLFPALGLTGLVLCGCSAALAATLQVTRPANTVKADETSIAAGKKLFSGNCAACHGATAEGDGTMAGELNPKPANLVDATWIHGSSDGDIFTVIRDGVKDTGMKAFGAKMTAHQIWNVVNYLRSIGPKSSDTPR